VYGSEDLAEHLGWRDAMERLISLREQIREASQEVRGIQQCVRQARLILWRAEQRELKRCISHQQAARVALTTVLSVDDDVCVIVARALIGRSLPNIDLTEERLRNLIAEVRADDQLQNAADLVVSAGSNPKELFSMARLVAEGCVVLWLFQQSCKGVAVSAQQLCYQIRRLWPARGKSFFFASIFVAIGSIASPSRNSY